jgi:hypothetical protein
MGSVVLHGSGVPAGEIVASGGSIFTLLVGILAVLFGAACYARTATFRRRIGRNPWGIHPYVWTVIGVLLGIFGLCFAFLACATTRPGPASGSNGSPPQGIQSGWGAWSAGPAPPPPPGAPPAGWYPDPSGRHQYRFFNGHDWTADVVDNGVHSAEPLAAPPVS